MLRILLYRKYFVLKNVMPYASRAPAIPIIFCVRTCFGYCDAGWVDRLLVYSMSSLMVGDRLGCFYFFDSNVSSHVQSFVMISRVYVPDYRLKLIENHADENEKNEEVQRAPRFIVITWSWFSQYLQWKSCRVGQFRQCTFAPISPYQVINMIHER